MAKQPFISHVVNGYSRYDVPESKAFTCTPGIAYPVRIDFINARDRVTIDQGIDVRSNPLAVPTFNPYTVRLHRFWVPLQLYHPEMRTNSSKFDMNNLSTNWIPSYIYGATDYQSPFGLNTAVTNSLFFWLRVMNTPRPGTQSIKDYDGVALPAPSDSNGFYGGAWANADTYLAYWDIVRNYYSYSQWSVYSFAWPSSWKVLRNASNFSWVYDFPNASACFFTQCYGNLEYLDAFFESQFYPSSVTSSNNTFNRSNLWTQIILSDLSNTDAGTGARGDGYPVSSVYAVHGMNIGSWSPNTPYDYILKATDLPAISLLSHFTMLHPMAVIPSSPDRFSRMLPPSDSTTAVSMTGVSTIPQLAVASRLQEYKDLLGAGGSRFSDWLETFFASKIEHVDRPKLIFSASQTVNAQVVMNQAGFNKFGGSNSSPLGAQGGTIAFNAKLGRSQSYYFREPGYMIDILSIRPVYYWTGIRPDYLDWQGSDYFNPIYNDIGYQDVPAIRFGSFSTGSVVVNQEPCFNEFRSSYDEVLGQMSYYGSPISEDPDNPVDLVPIYSYWVQQRSRDYIDANTRPGTLTETTARLLYTDLSTVNSPFASNLEDNFFINMSYSVRKKNLVNKTFATRLSNR